MERQIRIENALRGILEIGKRDMSNPKYDGYFAEAKEALNESTVVPRHDWRQVVLGLSWIPLHYRHDVIRNIETAAPVVLYKVGKTPPEGDQYEEVLVEGVSVTRVYESNDSFIDVRDVLKRLAALGIIQYREESEDTAGADEFCLECGKQLPHDGTCQASPE